MGVPVRDIKVVLSAVRVALETPGLAGRLLELCERNERVLEKVQEERAELILERDEVRRQLAAEREELSEWVRVERQKWAGEEALRRKKLEVTEIEIERRRDFLVGIDARLGGRKPAEEAA
jgi:hypothetical protein